ncbi:MAG: DUF881 domain-containing protein [Allobranchiibius sp.]
MATGTDRRPVDPAASMSLINELMKNPLDPAYQVEADRRSEADGKSSSRHSPVLIVTVILLGFALATGAIALRVPRTEQDRKRASLISRIETRQGEITSSSARIVGLRAEIAELQERALSRNNADGTASQLTRLSAGTGVATVSGPGIVLQVDDAATGGSGSGGDPRAAQDPQAGSSKGVVTSADLQIVVNGVWQAGADAVSINGQRLTGHSAIRSAGEAILVNFTPLAPPYEVSATGPASLKAGFERSEGGIYLAGLRNGFGIRSNIRTEKLLRLPAAVVPDLRFAKVVP